MLKCTWRFTSYLKHLVVHKVNKVGTIIICNPKVILCCQLIWSVRHLLVMVRISTTAKTNWGALDLN